MSNAIKLNDNAELQLPISSSGLFMIYLNNYQCAMTSKQPHIDISESHGFYMASVTSSISDDLTSWNIDITRKAAANLSIDGIRFSEEAKEALSHE
ncbi:MAG: hypothetical protein QMB71_00220 [Tolumonas sp.]